ncbi:hypothetical protein BJV78DRAFT_1253174 [Lactifluus subvellereus]|nr:hypothetical protein BJV78DRAFT_1253174 [Lactifluus subvellereus]
MAPLPRKASWRRADAITIRSDGVGVVSMSSVSGRQSGSRDGLLKSSSSPDAYMSLTKPTSSANSQLLSPTSNGVYTSSLPESSPAAINTTSPSTTDTGTFLHSLGDTSSPIVQPTRSSFLSAPVSTVSNPIPTIHIVTSSLSSSLLPAVTTKPPPASIAADLLDIVSSSLLDAQNAARISTPTSSIPSSTPYSTSSVADVTSSSLLPLTTTLSNNLLGPTETPTSLNKVLSTEMASMPAVASTPVDIPLVTLTPSLTPDLSTTDSGLWYRPTLQPTLLPTLSSPVLTRDYALSTGEGAEPANKSDALVDPTLLTTELSSTTTTSSIPATSTSTTVATTTTTTTTTTASTLTSTLPPNTILTLTPIPISSTTTASGEPIEITDTSLGIPINESGPNNETIDFVSVSSTPTDVNSSPETTSISGGATLATPVPSVTALQQGDGLHSDLSQLGPSVSALFTSFLVETGTTVTTTAAITTPTPAITPTVPTTAQTPSISVGTTLATSAVGIPLVGNGSQLDSPQLVPSGSIALTPPISSLVDLGTTTVIITPAIISPIPIASTTSIASVPSPGISSAGTMALYDQAGSFSTDPSVGISFTSSFTTNVEVVTFSFTEISGTLTSIPVTKTIPTVESTVVPVSSPVAKRNSVPVAAIAASTAAAVVLILILVGLCYCRRQHFRRASLPTFGFSCTPETQEIEAAPHSRLPSLLVSPPIRSTGGWNDPPVAASASAEPAQNPFADQIPILGEPSNTSRPFAAPPLTRAIHPVSVPDPFADPPVLVSTSEGELPSRLSKASSYDMHDPRALVASSNVGCAM